VTKESGLWLYRDPGSLMRSNPDPPRQRAGPWDARRVACAGVVLPFIALLLVVLSNSGCGHKAVSAENEAARILRAKQLIVSGNEAYRTGDYRLAARRYAAAAVVKQDDPAAYFGMGMALSKLGRDEEARKAYARSRNLTRTQAVLDFPGTRGSTGAPAETIP